MTVILISGKMGSGKTTLASFLQEELADVWGDYNAYTTSFALGVKELALKYFDINKNHKRGREVLQKIGQFGREIDVDTWVRYTFYDMFFDFSVMLPLYIIIDDWRYKSEVDSVHEYSEDDVYKVRIIREDLKEKSNHVSEIDLDDYEDFDVIFYNDGDLKKLKEFAKELAKEVEYKWKT